MAQHQQIAIQIRADDPLALSIQKKFDKVPYQLTTTKNEITIFRVPSHIRERNKNFYEPRMVSIGPYYRGREDLKCMENEKLRYLQKMLHGNPDLTLDDYLVVLRKLEPAARKCYYESVEMESNEFVEMLLYDACFIIELVVSWSFPDSDILSGVNWNIPLIKSDLLMLENQIPFFVLQCVFDLYTSRSDVDHSMTGGTEFNRASPTPSEDSDQPEEASLFYCLVEFLHDGNENFWVPEGNDPYDCLLKWLPSNSKNFSAPKETSPYGHLLDFYYNCYMRTQRIPNKPRKKSLLHFSIKWLTKTKRSTPSEQLRRYTIRSGSHMIKNRKHKPQTIPCATELQVAGITFKKAEVKSIFSVHFSHGVLTIPSISVTEETTPEIMNLIAFEQCNGEKFKPLTSYAVFMDCIVKMPRDVLILQKNAIIENKLGNEMTVAEFFNQLRYCSYLDYEGHHLAELFVNVKNYCDSSRWQKYKAKLLRDYFSNPWSITSFTAAVVLLLLTIVQTLYTVMPYYHPSD